MERATVPAVSPFADTVGYSRAVRDGRHVYVAGTAPVGIESDDAYEQARRCLAIVSDALRELGAGAEHVVRTRVYLVDAADWEAVGRAHGELFGEHRPASAMLVVADLLDPPGRSRSRPTRSCPNEARRPRGAVRRSRALGADRRAEVHPPSVHAPRGAGRRLRDRGRPRARPARTLQRREPPRRSGQRPAPDRARLCGSAFFAGYIALLVHSHPGVPGQQFDRVVGSTWRIVGASLGAFIVSETVDNLVGVPLRGRIHDGIRVIVSAGASAPIDSAVFLVLAFGTAGLHFFDGQLVGKIASSVVIGIPLLLAGRRFLPAKRGDIVPA